jgi:hypothetical protein
MAMVFLRILFTFWHPFFQASGVNLCMPERLGIWGFLGFLGFIPFLQCLKGLFGLFFFLGYFGFLGAAKQHSQ